jgi:hypothetical protein
MVNIAVSTRATYGVNVIEGGGWWALPNLWDINGFSDPKMLIGACHST